MRVACYYPWIYLPGGVERTILETCRRSRHQWTIFTSHYAPQNTFPGFADLQVIRLGQVGVRRDLLTVARAGLSLASLRLPLENFQALFIHCDGLGDLALLRNHRLPALAFCHTPLRAVFDPAYRARALAQGGPFKRLALGLGGPAFASLDRALWRRYDHLFFNSAETLRRARAGGLIPAGLPEGRVQVAHPGLDLENLRPTWNYERYFLLPGRIMWTKNIEAALGDFLTLADQGPLAGFRLVVAGHLDQKSRPYLEKLRGMAQGSAAVEFVLNPSDQRLGQLYAACWAVVFPPFNEDWGLVPLEANAFGKAVVAYDQGGPAESQAQGKTALLVPARAGELGRGMASLAAQPGLCRQMGQAAHLHSRAFGWPALVDKLDQALDRVSRGEMAPRRRAWGRA